MRSRFLLVTGALLLGMVPLLGGCQRPGRAASVKIVAYINVSSGCQAATVAFLQSLPARYPGVAVDLVDFGDGGPGMQRWQQAGLRCMTIQINGQSAVKFPVVGKMKVASFHMPAGFFWTHEDLEQAVQAAVQGKLQAATPEDLDAEPPPGGPLPGPPPKAPPST